MSKAKKTTTKPKHGGKREGAGRPLEGDARRTPMIGLRVTPEEKAAYEEMGGPSLVRNMILEYMDKKAREANAAREVRAQKRAAVKAAQQAGEPVTPLQAIMIRAIAYSPYNGVDGDYPEQPEWVWMEYIVTNAEDKGVFTSLKKAGLVENQGQGSATNDRNQNPAVCRLTDEGFRLFQQIDPPPAK